jgi:hypothetical protein
VVYVTAAAPLAANTLVMGPGGYRFSDYWRLGLPITAGMLLPGIPLILYFFPAYKFFLVIYKISKQRFKPLRGEYDGNPSECGLYITASVTTTPG